MTTIIIGLMVFFSIALILFAVVMAIDLNKLINAEARAELEAQRIKQKAIFKWLKYSFKHLLTGAYGYIFNISEWELLSFTNDNDYHSGTALSTWCGGETLNNNNEV